MVGEERTCAARNCDEEFLSKTANQKYHNDECCRLETNRKIMDKYYARRAIKLGKIRHCECGVKLSRYNPGERCNACLLSEEVSNRSIINGLFSDIELIA